MNPDDAKRIAETIGPMLAALGAWWSANKAAKRSKPTGNGFAKNVTDSLERIETKVDSQAKKQKKTDKRLKRLETNEPAPNQNPSDPGGKSVRDVRPADAPIRIFSTPANPGWASPALQAMHGRAIEDVGQSGPGSSPPT